MGLDGPAVPPGYENPPWVVVTPSRVAEFRKCKRAYFNSTILSLRGEEVQSPASEIGLLVHTILADSHAGGRCISQAVISDAATVYGDEIAAILENHVECCPVHSRREARLLGTEMELAWWDSQSRTYFSGRLDAIWDVSGTLTVRDYKTGKHYDEDHRLRFDVSAYAVLAAAHFTEIRPVAVEFEYLASGDLEQIEFDKCALDDALASIRKTASEISSARRFPGSPGPICENCDFRSSCPESAS